LQQRPFELREKDNENPKQSHKRDFLGWKEKITFSIVGRHVGEVTGEKKSVLYYYF